MYKKFELKVYLFYKAQKIAFSKIEKSICFEKPSTFCRRPFPALEAVVSLLATCALKIVFGTSNTALKNKAQNRAS